jgi:hypothetical protein
LNSNIYYLFTFFIILIFGTLSCKDQEVDRKIDAQLRIQIKTLYEASQLDKTISIVFKSNETLTDLHRQVLKDKGIEINANIGQIYTAKLPARSLYDLANMKFVESIQGSRELKIQSVDSLNQVPKF